MVVLYSSSASKFRKMSIYVAKFSLDNESPLTVSNAGIVISGENKINGHEKYLVELRYPRANPSVSAWHLWKWLLLSRIGNS